MFHKKKNLDLIIAIVVSALVLSGSIVFYALQTNSSIDDEAFQERVEKAIDVYIQKQKDEYTKQQEEANKPKTVSGDFTDDDAVTGDKDAPVTIVEFSDFQCPYCEVFVTKTLPQIEKKYIDTGKVKLVFRDFPLSFHEHSLDSAEAAECVRDQLGDEAYFKYHDLLFKNQGALAVDDLLSYSSKVGANKSKVKKCMDDDKFLPEIKKDMDDAKSAGISGTPAFIIDGQVISGAQPFKNFEKVIDGALNK